MNNLISFLLFSLTILSSLSFNITAMSSTKTNSTQQVANSMQSQSSILDNNSQENSVRSSEYRKLYNVFTAHPNAHHMTYWSHFHRAVKFSLKMGYGSFCLIIHAFFPFLFETVGSDTIKELYADLSNHSKSGDSARHI